MLASRVVPTASGLSQSPKLPGNGLGHHARRIVCSLPRAECSRNASATSSVTWSPSVAMYRLSKSRRARSDSRASPPMPAPRIAPTVPARSGSTPVWESAVRAPVTPRVSTMRRIGRRAASGSACSSFLAWRRAFLRDPAAAWAWVLGDLVLVVRDVPAGPEHEEALARAGSRAGAAPHDRGRGQHLEREVGGVGPPRLLEEVVIGGFDVRALLEGERVVDQLARPARWR